MPLFILTKLTAVCLDASLCRGFNISRSFTHDLVYLCQVALVLIYTGSLQGYGYAHGASTCICKGPKRRTVVDTVKEIVSRMSAAVG